MLKLIFIFVMFLTTLRVVGQPIDTSSYDHKIKVACIGDSITFGLGISKRSSRSYPSQLAKMLGDDWEVRNYGLNSRTLLSGGDFPYSKEYFYIKAKKWLPDVVVIMLGTNDSKPWNWKHFDEFEKDYSDFLAPFKDQIPQPRIFICQTPPVIKNVFGINGDNLKNLLNPVIKKIAENENVPCIDMYTPLAGRNDLFSDGLHPDAEGARIIANEVYKALTGINSD